MATSSSPVRTDIRGALFGLAVGSASASLITLGGTPMQFLLSIESVAASAVIHTALTTLAVVLICRSADLSRHGVASLAVSGMYSGLLCWILGPLTFGPLVRGEAPTWSVVAVGDAFPALVTQVLMGALIGLGIAVLRPEPTIDLRTPDSVAAEPRTRVVVLGGGFGGVAVAQQLGRDFGADPEVDVALVSMTNSLLFTPMLAEVAGSSLDGRHISAPLRAACPQARVLRLRAEGVDVGMQSVLLRDPDTDDITVLQYDHLVFALGSVPNFRDIDGLEEHAFTLKTLADAGRLRNHVIRQLERADGVSNRAERARLLTFVVAGGGFAGTETIAELFDLAHGVIRSYPNIDPAELRFILVHSQQRILPEISDELARYSLRSLKARGIQFRLGERVIGADAESVFLGGGERIHNATLVWTAGNRPSSVLSSMRCEVDASGRLITDPWLRLSGHENLWAVGDCALIASRSEVHGFCPPTAQHAQRQGSVVGKNIAASITGRDLQPFEFKTKGILVALGHRTAVAEVGRLRFSGVLAWLMWRAIYLAKLPGLEKRLRVFLDWSVDLVAPRDTVLTDADESQPVRPSQLTVPSEDGTQT